MLPLALLTALATADTIIGAAFAAYRSERAAFEAAIVADYKRKFPHSSKGFDIERFSRKVPKA